MYLEKKMEITGDQDKRRRLPRLIEDEKSTGRGGGSDAGGGLMAKFRWPCWLA